MPHLLPEQMKSDNMESDTMMIGSYALLKKIGSGFFGSVYLCKHIDTNQSFAAKLFKMKFIMKPSFPGLGWPMVAKEVDVLRKLNHPRIVKYEDIVFSPYGVLVVMELVHGRTLFDCMPREGGFVESFAWVIFKQLLEAAEFLHKNGIVHRDIKLENVMLDREGNLKVIDFGLANCFPINDQNNERHVHEDMMVYGLSGTKNYWAPELLSSHDKVCGDKVDIWTMGVFLYCLVSGYYPFDDDDDEVLFESICFERVSFKDTDFSQDLKDLLLKILEKDPEQRASLSAIMTHPWVKRERYSGCSEAHQSFYEKYPGKTIGNAHSPLKRASSGNAAFPMATRNIEDNVVPRPSRSCNGKFVSEHTGKPLAVKFPLGECSTCSSVGTTCGTESAEGRGGNKIRTFIVKAVKKIKRGFHMRKRSSQDIGERDHAARANSANSREEDARASRGTGNANRDARDRRNPRLIFHRILSSLFLHCERRGRGSVGRT